MGINLRDDLVATPPKLTLTSFPSHKPLPATPGALTPPLHPMVSVPFEWEEAPGRPRPGITSGLNNSKPKSFRCLELPPRIAHVTNSSPTTVLDGPKLGRTLSHRFYLEDIGPKSMIDDFGLGLNYGLDQRKSDYGPCNWALEKPNVEYFNNKSRSVRSDVEIDVRMKRFRRTKGSLYKLSCKSSRFIVSF
ncbi:hypothetical protein RND81_14G099300 [Saponaria officinalis]|uniref:Uncharacterized protein n=1 Tax=Saponaria officinalis TaxID=3572 RepID=A0AAW1GMV3_SAPOF